MPLNYCTPRPRPSCVTAVAMAEMRTELLSAGLRYVGTRINGSQNGEAACSQVRRDIR
jgi:hypothetical protein